MKKFEFKIHGPIKGGKNHIMITRTGHRYPNPKFAAWRDEVVNGLVPMIGAYRFDAPVSIKVIYTPFDLKRRDMPAMLDSIFHCMEKAGLIEDDCLVKDLQWTARAKDKENAGVSVFLEDLP